MPMSCSHKPIRSAIGCCDRRLVDVDLHIVDLVLVSPHLSRNQGFAAECGARREASH